MVRLKPIDDQVIVVMGASSGIGRETALQFARRGAQLVVSARGKDGLESLVDEIRREGGEASALPADVTRFDDVKRVADHAVSTYGRLDTWVHLAAVSLYATFEETTPEEFKQIVDTNLMGQVYGAMAALPHLRREGGGALIHVSSIEALRTLPLQSAYGAAKHGIVGFLEALRLELRHDGLPISVTNVMPATINTPLFNKARTKLGVKPKGLPPIYQPSVVAETILHAAEHPTRDIYAGGAARLLALNQALSPRTMDAFFSKTAFRGQRTKEVKGTQAPDNLFAPLAGYNRIEGDFGDQAVTFSPYTRLQTNPWLMPMLAGLTLGVAAGVVLNTRNNRHEPEPGTRSGVGGPGRTNRGDGRGWLGTGRPVQPLNRIDGDRGR